MSYKAIVSRIATRPIEGRDKIVAGSCHGFQIITSKDTQDGQLGVFFEAGGQVSEEFAEQNDLYVRKDPETGARINSGYFEPNRRVKSIRLAGMRSEGFFVTLDALAYTGFDLSTLKEGDVFDELNVAPRIETLNAYDFVKRSRQLCTCNVHNTQTERLKQGACAAPVTELGSEEITPTMIKEYESIILGTQKIGVNTTKTKIESGTQQTKTDLNTGNEGPTTTEPDTSGSRKAQRTNSQDESMGINEPTESRSPNTKSCADNRGSAANCVTGKPNYTLTMITEQDALEVFCVAGATGHLDGLAIMRNLYREHSDTCRVKSWIKLRDGRAVLSIPEGKYKICQKYYSPATLRAMRGGTKRTRRENRMFSEHVDTEPLRRHLADIPAGALITLTEKIHGTSHQIGHVLDEVPAPEGRLKRAMRLAKNWLLKTTDTAPTTSEWTILNGSRRVILEIIYGEIVGFTDQGRPIMEPQTISDKDLKKKFGDQFVYTYGQPEGTCGFYIYRITRTNEDGDEVDLSWFEIERRARQLGIPTVPFIESFIFDGNHRDLLDRVDLLVNGKSGDEAIPSSLDSRHIQEGVVVRSDSSKGTTFFKHKSFCFGIHEGYLKEKDSHVDLEEVS